MSEIGYPLIGDTSIWDLHMAEWRILAEGFRVKNERQEQEMERHSDGEYSATNRKRNRRQQQATDEMASEYAKELQAAKDGRHPAQEGQAA